MIVGDQPLLFYLEILIRSAIIYGYFFLLLRWIGRRAKSGLSIIEVILIVALGSAVGDGTFYPEVPILHALLVITLVTLFNQGLQYGIQQHEPFRHWVEGRPLAVLRDGVLLPDHIDKAGFEEHDIKEMLRVAGVCNLGQLALVVLEPSSELSVYRRSEPAPGLCILPRYIAEQIGDTEVSDNHGVCCRNCASEALDGETCSNCGETGTTARTMALYEL